jgi:hypothetical protein
MVIKISYLRVLLSFCWFNHTKLVFEQRTTIYELFAGSEYQILSEHLQSSK